MTRLAVAVLALASATMASPSFAAEPVTTLAEVGRLKHAYVNKIAFSPSGKLCVTASVESIKLWEATTWKMLAEFEAHRVRNQDGPGESIQVSGLQFTSDDKTLITAGDDGNVCFWSIPAMTRQAVLAEPWVYREGPQGVDEWWAYRRVPAGAIALTPDGKTLVVSRNETLQCIDMATRKVVRQFGRVPWLEPWSVDKVIPADQEDRTKARSLFLSKVYHFAHEPTEPLQQLKSTMSLVHHLQFSPDGRYLVADYLVYEFATGEVVPDLRIRALSPDGEQMVVWNNRLQEVCKFPSGEVLHELDTRAWPIGFYDRRTLYLCEGAFLKLFDLDSGHMVWMSSEERASSVVHVMALSSQGVIAASWDGWDLGNVYLYRAGR